jgi:SnoaL-like domain
VPLRQRPQGQAVPPATVTVMELWELVVRESCRDTLAQYTHAGDRFLLEEFVAAFCEDGVLEIRGSDPVRGRRAIMERFGGGTAALQARQAAKALQPGATRRVVRHNVTNILFESVSPTEAAVASYFTVFTEVGLDHMGRYRDRLVPVAGRWLIAHRFVSVDWHAPDSTFGGLTSD